MARRHDVRIGGSLRPGLRLGLALVLLVVFLGSSARAEDEKKAPSRLGMSVFGPDETGYPFATMEGSAKDLETLRFRVRDGKDQELFTFDVQSGSTLLYVLEERPGDDERARVARAKRCVELIEARFRAAGYFDATVRAESGGRIRVHIPAHSIDGGAPLATLVSSTGAVELRAEVGPGETQGWSGTKAELLAFKKEEVKRWRASRAAGRAPTPSRSAYRLVLSGAHDGSQPYHFKVVEEGPAVEGFDRSLFDRVEAVDDEVDGWLLRLRWAKGARARFESWRKANKKRDIALLVHGRHYATLSDEDIMDDGLAFDVRGWPCRPLASWGGDLGRSLVGDPLPGQPRLLARVNYEAGPEGSFSFYAPMAPTSVMQVQASAPGAKDVKPVTCTRKHKHGHFLKYYFITMSYLGARNCGDVPIELAVWTKYQETKSVLLSFNVGITLTHHAASPLAIMAAEMLGGWRADEEEVVRRLKMGLEMKQAERRWAAARGLADRVAAGLFDKFEAAGLLRPLLEDDVERVRIAAAIARLELGVGEDADRKLLAAGKTSEDPWVAWASARAKAK